MTLTHPPEPQTSVRADVDRAGSLFRAFATEGFQEWRSWRRLRRVLSSNGGSYGLVGPRGAGKTWLMMRAVDEADESGGVGLWFPSPSEYDPQAFLSSLSDSFAARVERQFRSGVHVPSPVAVLGLISLMFPVGLWAADQVPGVEIAQGSALLPITAAAIAIALGLGIAGLMRAVTRAFPRGRLVAEARTLQERIRYSTTLTHGSQAGGGVGQGLFNITSSEQRELIERPTTISSLVHDFRRLGRHTAEVVKPARVVIAIDELDKMSDPDKVRALLRDIKGIFEIEGVHFLVSVSHEAARALRLAGVAERNEFNSSFYTAVELPVLKPGECADLLAVREQLGLRDRIESLRARRPNLQGRKREAADEEIKRLRYEIAEAPPDDDTRQRWAAIGVLAAGNPRETIRLADLADENRAATARAAIAAVLTTELVEFRREALVTDLTEDEKTGMYHAVRRLVGDGESMLAVAGTAVVELWTPEWGRATWRTHFAEEWRRLLVRLQVGAWMAGDGRLSDETTLVRLSSVVAEASLSAIAARLMLSEPPFALPPPSGE